MILNAYYYSFDPTGNADLLQLKALAEAASNGPWSYTGQEYGDRGGQFHNVESPVESIVGEFGPSRENARFIAAANPTVVIELIQKIESLRTELAQKEAAAHGDERTAFETAFCPATKDRKNWMRRDRRGDYSNPAMQSAWQGWQARAALAQPVAIDAPQGWISVQDRLPKCSKKSDSFGVQVLVWPHVKEDGCADMVSAFYGKRASDAPNFYLYGRVLNGITHWMLPPAAPVSAIDVQDGEATK